HRLLLVLDEAESERLITDASDPGLEATRREQARESLIRLLLDRHGIGRVMFRNTRARISGFPQRELQAYSLPMPEAYAAAAAAPQADPAEFRLTPERTYAGLDHADWWRFDPRVDWLIGFLREHTGVRLLLICAHAATAIELQEALRVRAGIRAGLFHEGMSIIERDRAAAWFADPEGARLLVCSEIGSEGRNFQFVHHLVLFDLPADPDLLEQRIGRLDRIGQRETVQIHVPYLEPSAQAVMLRWYRDGLDAFRHQVRGAREICDGLSGRLWAVLLDAHADSDIDGLIDETRALRRETEARLKQGRDHLLELSACREPEAGELVAALQRQDAAPQLRDYLEALFDSYGVDSEPLGEAGLILRQGEEVIAGTLPGLPPDGATATFSRGDALGHEDRLFLTWEHPLVTDAMEQVITQQTGNSVAVALRHPRLKGGQLLLETLFVAACVAPRQLHADRFLPPTLIRILLDPAGRRLDAAIPCAQLMTDAQPLEPQQMAQLLAQYRATVERMLGLAQAAARLALPAITRQATGTRMAEYTRS
ncbi:MAG: RNA polymerase-associated protein RapA, partial [Candidatus Thiodiazotropha sp.]